MEIGSWVMNKVMVDEDEYLNSAALVQYSTTRNMNALMSAALSKVSVVIDHLKSPRRYELLKSDHPVEE